MSEIAKEEATLMVAAKEKKIKVAKEPKVKAEKVIDIPYGMVIHTDGGTRGGNPGYSGFGIHGYVYGEVPPTKGAGNPTNLLTSTGYIEKSSVKDNKSSISEVKPLYYINGYGSIPGMTSNNVAEISGAINALHYAKDYDVKEVTIITDSEQVVKAASGWIQAWSKNNWIKSDGNPVANQPYWKHLASNIQSLEEKNTTVKFQWIKGHNKHLGNELADKLATIGVMKAKAGEIITEIDKVPADGYWSKTVDKHPFIAQRRMYFCTLPDSVKRGEYYMGNHGKDDELLGKRMADGYYSYVELTEPDLALEMMRDKQVELADGQDVIIMARLDKVFDSATHADIINYGKIVFYAPFHNKLDMHFIDAEPVTKELKPPRLAMRAIEEVNILKGIADSYKTGNHKFKETDITDKIYEIDKKGNFKLRPEFTAGFSKITLNVNYGNIETNSIDVELTLGVDLFERNALKKLEKYNPNFKVLTWMESEEMFRYVTIITAGKDTAIVGGMYSNMRYVFKK